MAERGEIQERVGSVSSPGYFSASTAGLPPSYPFRNNRRGRVGRRDPAFQFAPMQGFFRKAAPWAGVSRGSLGSA